MTSMQVAAMETNGGGGLDDNLKTSYNQWNITHSNKYILLPNGRLRAIIDWIVMVCLIYTCIVTPFEVAFLETTLGVLFALNRAVDLVFLFDIISTFFTPIIDYDSGLWITDHKEIARVYLRGWFWLDVISTIPFDWIGYASASSENVENLQGLRLLRLLRLIKLARLVRASRILKRWQIYITWKNSSVTLLRFAVLILLLCHWTSCFMGLIPTMEGNTYALFNSTEIDNGAYPKSWIGFYFKAALGLNPDSYTIWSVYLAGYYYAVMTFTTIGYGDVTPKTDTERALVVCIMLLGATVYAYIIGTVCGIVASYDMVKKDHQHLMDELYDFFKAHRLNPVLKQKIRKLLMQSVRQMRYENTMNYLQQLTPQLRDELSYYAMKDKLDGVPFYSKIPEQEREMFLGAIGSKLTLRIYPPLEILQNKGERILRVGFIARGSILFHNTKSIHENHAVTEENMSLYVRKSVSEDSREEREKESLAAFGLELMRNSEATCGYYVSCIAYTDVLELSGEDLEVCLKIYPLTRSAFR